MTTATAAPAAPALATAVPHAVVELQPAGSPADSPWLTVCALDRLLPGRGVAALLPDGSQVALFLDSGGRVHAIDNRDPFTGAAVLSRGLLGSADGRPYVASPLLKQRFDLIDGRCLDEDTVRVPVHRVRTI